MGSLIGELGIRTWAGVLHAFWESTLGNEKHLSHPSDLELWQWKLPQKRSISHSVKD